MIYHPDDQWVRDCYNERTQDDEMEEALDEQEFFESPAFLDGQLAAAIAEAYEGCVYGRRIA